MSQLPYNLELLPGVRTDHKGRPYQIGRYPSGKSVTVYVENNLNVPAARTIPVPKEPERKPRKLMTTGLNGEKKPVVFIPRRLHVVEVRWKGQKQVSKHIAPNPDGRQWFSNNVMPLSRWTGKEWIPIEETPADYHNQYHIDEEVK